MAVQSPHVTIYEKETGKGKRIYRASLHSFLKTGLYTQERPVNATDGDDLARINLPVAGREASRKQELEAHTAAFNPDSLGPSGLPEGLGSVSQPESEDASPKRSQPRRRKPSAEDSTSTAEATSTEAKEE